MKKFILSSLLTTILSFPVMATYDRNENGSIDLFVKNEEGHGYIVHDIITKICGGATIIYELRDQSEDQVLKIKASITPNDREILKNAIESKLVENIEYTGLDEVNNQESGNTTYIDYYQAHIAFCDAPICFSLATSSRFESPQQLYGIENEEDEREADSSDDQPNQNHLAFLDDRDDGQDNI